MLLAPLKNIKWLELHDLFLDIAFYSELLKGVHRDRQRAEAERGRERHSVAFHVVWALLYNFRLVLLILLTLLFLLQVTVDLQGSYASI